LLVKQNKEFDTSIQSGWSSSLSSRSSRQPA
jgi:hypothetical protein